MFSPPQEQAIGLLNIIIGMSSVLAVIAHKFISEAELSRTI
jgi:hypothetical protein